jgi:hypothetical protein
MNCILDAEQPTIEAFMEDEGTTNFWLKYKCLCVYVRKGFHFARHRKGAVAKPCLMVASLNVDDCIHNRGDVDDFKPVYRHASQLVEFMRKVELTARREGYHGVFVENANNPQHQELLAKHGYRRNGTVYMGKRPNHFYKPCTAMKSEHFRWPEIAGPCTGLKQFFIDPTVGRTWVRDHPSGMLLYLKRSRQADATGQASSMCLRVIDTCENRASDSAGTLYWRSDRKRIEMVIDRLERQAWRQGFASIQIDAFAFGNDQAPLHFMDSCGVPPGRPGDWLLERGYVPGPAPYCKTSQPTSDIRRTG